MAPQKPAESSSSPSSSAAPFSRPIMSLSIDVGDVDHDGRVDVSLQLSMSGARVGPPVILGEIESGLALAMLPVVGPALRDLTAGGLGEVRRLLRAMAPALLPLLERIPNMPGPFDEFARVLAGAPNRPR